MPKREQEFSRRSAEELDRIAVNLIKLKVAELQHAQDMMELIERAGPGDGQGNDTIRVCREAR